MSKVESGGVPHQVTWSPQSPSLKPTEMEWDELDRRVMQKTATPSEYKGTSSRIIPVNQQLKLFERMQAVCKAVIKAKTATLKNI